MGETGRRTVARGADGEAGRVSGRRRAPGREPGGDPRPTIRRAPAGVDAQVRPADARGAPDPEHGARRRRARPRPRRRPGTGRRRTWRGRRSPSARRPSALGRPRAGAVERGVDGLDDRRRRLRHGDAQAGAVGGVRARRHGSVRLGGRRGASRARSLSPNVASTASPRPTHKRRRDVQGPALGRRAGRGSGPSASGSQAGRGLGRPAAPGSAISNSPPSLYFEGHLTRMCSASNTSSGPEVVIRPWTTTRSASSKLAGLGLA